MDLSQLVEQALKRANRKKSQNDLGNMNEFQLDKEV